MALDLKKKIGGGFGLLLLVFALFGGLCIMNLREQRAVVSEVVNNDMPMVDVLNESAMLLQLYRKAEKDVLLTIGEPKKQQDYFAKLQSLSASTRKNLAELDQATARNEDLKPEVRKLPAEAVAGFDKYDKVVLALAARLVADPSGRAMDYLEANALLSKEKDSMHRAETVLKELQEASSAMFHDNQQDLATLAGRTETLLMASVLVALLAGVVVSFLTLRSITRPLGRIMDLAGAVAKGDLHASVGGVFTAEMAQLKESIEAMLAALKSKIAEADQKSSEAAEQARLAAIATDEANQAKALAERAKAEGMMAAANQLEKVVEVVSSASEELSAQIEQSSRGTEVQSQRVGETATAMEEMNATVLEVAKNASQAAESSASARLKALDGAKVVAQVVAGINTMQRVSLDMKSDMGELGRQAEGIGAIMNVISDIADQTNLLALNAAIEAARAGDAGRGFAVVADEVRKLAEKTMAATKEVGQAISGIQQGARKNLDNVDRAAATIEQATSLASTSGEALQEIVRLVEVSTDQVRSIAAASEEQSAASEEINRSIEDINRISSETASAMTQSAQAVGELASQAGNLRQLIEQMKRGG